MANQGDFVKLKLPLNKEYAQLLRVCVASLASRLDFNIDQIEDIKMALEEAFLLALQESTQKTFDASFFVEKKRLVIDIINAHIHDFEKSQLKQKYSFFIMTSLVDKVDIKEVKDNTFNIKLIKNLV